ncbi:hypothetical protein [Mycobacterium florentinum]|nr:hypothetical protein [Mycobacterium florentinum]MCV7413134.1 hypothetical protein [Mycobacterium florentinum]
MSRKLVGGPSPPPQTDIAVDARSRAEAVLITRQKSGQDVRVGEQCGTAETDERRESGSAAVLSQNQHQCHNHENALDSPGGRHSGWRCRHPPSKVIDAMQPDAATKAIIATARERSVGSGFELLGEADGFWGRRNATVLDLRAQGEPSNGHKTEIAKCPVMSW